MQCNSVRTEAEGDPSPKVILQSNHQAPHPQQPQQPPPPQQQQQQQQPKDRAAAGRTHLPIGPFHSSVRQPASAAR